MNKFNIFSRIRNILHNTERFRFNVLIALQTFCIYPVLDTSSRHNLLKNLQGCCNKPTRSITDPHRLSIVLNRQSQWQKSAEIDSFSKSLPKN